MESPLLRLRELLPFGHDDGSAASLRSHMQALAGLSASATASRLTTEVLPLIVGQDNLHMRFKLLEEACHAVERVLPALEGELLRAAMPLPKPAVAAALLADNLLKALAHAYAGIARGIVEQKQDAALAHLLFRGTRRAVSSIARRQLLAYRAYASPSAASWQMLHGLYRLACQPQFRPLDDEAAVIEQEYLGALIFAYLEPNKQARRELNAIRACARQLAAHARIGEATSQAAGGRSAESCFLVRPDHGSPGYPLTRLPAGTSLAGSLIVDCTAVLAELDRRLSLPASAGQPAEQTATPALLQNLRLAIGGKSARRFSRSRFRPRADLVGGLAQVIGFLNGNVYSRRSLDGRHEARAGAASEWSLIDESPNGFRVRYVKGDQWTFGVGDVVALQPRESSRIHVCMVRRIASIGNRLELGLQLLSPQVSIVSLANGSGAPMPALYLHSLPAYGKTAGLIVPPGKLRRGQPIAFASLGRTLRRQIGQCIEANDGLEFVALDPLPE